VISDNRIQEEEGDEVINSETDLAEEEKESQMLLKQVIVGELADQSTSYSLQFILYM
jgi:hypothetical protein